MDTIDACKVIEDFVYKPGWTFEAEPHPIEEGCALVKATYYTWLSNRPLAPSYRERDYLLSYHSVPCTGTEEDVEDALFEKVVARVEIHEAREFFRRRSQDYRAPLHPHTDDGKERWGDQEGDRLYGKGVTKLPSIEDLLDALAEIA